MATDQEFQEAQAILAQILSEAREEGRLEGMQAGIEAGIIVGTNRVCNAIILSMNEHGYAALVPSSVSEVVLDDIGIGDLWRPLNDQTIAS